MRGLWRYLFILVAIILLWNQVVLRPVKILSLFFHKTGHALTAFFFGFGSESFRITFDGVSDTIISSKGWLPSFIIANGGYIASALFFVIIMYLKRTKAKKYLLGCLSIIYLIITISNPGLRNAIIYSVIFTSIVTVLIMIQRDGIEELVIDVIGLSAITYIIYDTFIATILLKLNQQFSIIKGWNSGIPEDIIRMSNVTGVPQVLWAIIWLVLSVLVLNAVILKSLRNKRRF